LTEDLPEEEQIELDIGPIHVGLKRKELYAICAMIAAACKWNIL